MPSPRRPASPVGFGSTPGGLPGCAGTIVGRRHELSTVPRAVGEHRLVSVTGPGGCGKTRLLLELLRGPLTPAGTDLWWVDLRPAADAAALTALVAGAIGLEPAADLSSERLAAAIGDRRAVLVLDTCEHILDPCARLVVDLVGRCPALRVFTTSREALAVPGELLVPVPALSVPPVRERPSRAEVAAAEAAQLFVDRAHAVAPDFELTEANAGAVAELCVRLDGLPRAIELAASRVPDHPAAAIRVAEILAAVRADDSADTCRSYRLLGAAQQAVLRRLSVLPRDAGFDAAEAVCATGGVSPGELPRLLADLAAKSLIVRRGGGIRQFETIRWYAGERLTEAGERAAARAGLIAWLGDRADEFAATAFVPESTQTWIADQHECLALAVRWTAADGGDRHAAPAALLAWHSARTGAFAATERLLDGALRRSPSARYQGVLLTQLGAVRLATGAHADGIRQLGRAIAAHQQAGNTAGLAAALLTLGAVRARTDEPAAAQRHYTDALELLTERGDRVGVAACRQYLAWLAASHGDADRADRITNAALPVLRAHGERRLVAFGLCTAGASALCRDDLVTAESMFCEAAESGGDDELPVALDGLAATAVRAGQYRRAIVLAAGAERFARTLPTSPWRSLLADAPPVAAVTVDAEERRSLRGLARRLTRRQLVEHAHGGSAVRPPLSLREHQIAEFVADGLTNRRVAARLRISEQTVGSHISNIFAKLDIRSRCELATWLAERASA